VRDEADHASDLGKKSSLFSKIRIDRLRQNDTTGNLRMARMRELPVVQPCDAQDGRPSSTTAQRF
jgi:hypothetical protein